MWRTAPMHCLWPCMCMMQEACPSMRGVHRGLAQDMQAAHAVYLGVEEHVHSWIDLPTRRCAATLGVLAAVDRDSCGAHGAQRLCRTERGARFLAGVQGTRRRHSAWTGAEEA